MEREDRFIGRYYHNQFGEEGKFWFAVQPSDDPETVFHATDVTDKSGDEGFDEGYADYDISDDEFVKRKLDELFDILEVPHNKRRYSISAKDRVNYIWKDLFDYIFTYDKEKGVGDMPYGTFKGDKHITYYPLSKEKELAASRLDLGIFIYNTIKRDGSCQITAEL